MLTWTATAAMKAMSVVRLLMSRLRAPPVLDRQISPPQIVFITDARDDGRYAAGEECRRLDEQGGVIFQKTREDQQNDVQRAYPEDGAALVRQADADQYGRQGQGGDVGQKREEDLGVVFRKAREQGDAAKRHGNGQHR